MSGDMMGRHATPELDAPTEVIKVVAREPFTTALDQLPFKVTGPRILAAIAAVLLVVVGLAVSGRSDSGSNPNQAIDFSSAPVASYITGVEQKVLASRVEPYKTEWVEVGQKGCGLLAEGRSWDDTVEYLAEGNASDLGVPTSSQFASPAWMYSAIAVNQAIAHLCNL